MERIYVMLGAEGKGLEVQGNYEIDGEGLNDALKILYKHFA